MGLPCGRAKNAEGGSVEALHLQHCGMHTEEVRWMIHDDTMKVPGTKACLSALNQTDGRFPEVGVREQQHAHQHAVCGKANPGAYRSIRIHSVCNCSCLKWWALKLLLEAVDENFSKNQQSSLNALLVLKSIVTTFVGHPVPDGHRREKLQSRRELFA